MSRWVALLRGVNVGGRNRLAMAELRDALTEAGHRSVSTYIQSGNIVFDTDDGSSPASTADDLRRLLVEQFELDVAVVAFPAERLTEVEAANPYPELVVEPKFLHVYFTQDPVADDALDDIDLDRFLPDTAEVAAGVIYAAYPSGMARSRLTASVLDRAVGQPTTARNWSTVRKLAELTSDINPVDH